MRKRTIIRLQARQGQLEAERQALQEILDDESHYHRSREDIVPEELCDDEALAETERLGEQLAILENIISALNNIVVAFDSLMG
jgi:hypothetical protein